MSWTASTEWRGCFSACQAECTLAAHLTKIRCILAAHLTEIRLICDRGLAGSWPTLAAYVQRGTACIDPWGLRQWEDAAKQFTLALKLATEPAETARLLCERSLAYARYALPTF